MKRFFLLLMDVRVLSVLGLAALAAFLFLGAGTLQIALVWAGVAIAAAVLVWFAVWVVRKLLNRRAAKKLEAAMNAENDKAQQKATSIDERAEMRLLRERMNTAVKTIRTSKLGLTTGAAALYELPWYMVIGNPAAGKSTAVVKSGLNFPFADNHGNIIQGIGGTRNCDWFFTNEGILLDTAGRYSVHDEDRQEWLGFLNLLKKHRAKAPINGILIAASVAELTQAKPEAAIQLAKNLRQRVQELTEKLEVFAPVYLVFTKTDLVSGFVEFFEDRDRDERASVWGATLPYDPTAKVDAVAEFDRHFDELRDGLKEQALARMTLQRGQALPPGVLTFPLEFNQLKPALRAFVATLFEDNPYQFRPVFRGFYFTSAVQEGTASSRASQHVAQRFALQAPTNQTTAAVYADNGFFLKDLFSKVVFADRDLVKQYTSRTKQHLRKATFAAAVVGLAAALGLWSWSYLGNRQLMSNVQADLDKVARLQADKFDLASRLEAMEVLQDRIEQLQGWRDNRPIGVSLGLYQGQEMERKLRAEYFAGLRQIMIEPVTQSLEAYLAEVNANAGNLQPMTRPPGSGIASLGLAAAAPAGAASAPTAAVTPAVPSRFVDASATSVEEAYNALKTYLMLAEQPRMETSHLGDQLTRFWRNWLDDNRGVMPREQLNRSAERMMTFALGNLQDPIFPVVQNNLSVVDTTRDSLRKVMRGMPARERVYAEVKARANTRFPAMTVAEIVGDGKTTVAGSHVVPGAFTRKAWDEYVQTAFKDAANNELQTDDWVLKISARDDLSLEGSPDQVRKVLTELYKAEYVAEWQRFMQGVSVASFATFDDAVLHMNRLGDKSSSPIKLLLTELSDQTSWDNPSLLNERLAKTQKGVMDWIKQSILRQAPSRVEMKVDVAGGDKAIPMGPIGKEFAALQRIMMSRDSNPALIEAYMEQLGKLRARFNTMKNQGDIGPATKSLLASTLEGGKDSELAEALRFVDEQMLTGMTPSARQTLRPLLVRPLIQATAVIVPAVETEVNRQWAAQVHEPFQRTLAGKYPFDANSRIEAGPAEIAKVFGPDGAVAKFGNDVLGNLVVRRGDAVTTRSWAEIGIRLKPEFSAGFGNWVAPLEGASGGGGGAGAEQAAQTAFQLLPQGAPGMLEYTIEVDGQVLRYRNTAPVWTDMVWPNPSGQPGVRITGITVDGRSVEILNVPGNFGLHRMVEAAAQKRLPDGANEMTWTGNGQSVTVHLRLIRKPGAVAGSAGASTQGGAGLRGLRLPALVAGVEGAAAPATAASGAAR